MEREEKQHKRNLELDESKIKSTSAMLSNFTGQGINTESTEILGPQFFSSLISSVLNSRSGSSSSSTSNNPSSSSTTRE
jgi:hypothetical protein